jgi:phosphoribosyl-AMP cyclohydrolase
MNLNIEQKQLEEGKELTLDYSKMSEFVKLCKDIIPVAVQDMETMEVILVAYTNQKAFEHTFKTGTATFWSTSRNELWIKGKSSGNTFMVKNIFVNCEQNSLLYMVKRNAGGICHTFNKSGKSRNCFYRKLNMKDLTLENIDP